MLMQHEACVHQPSSDVTLDSSPVSESSHVADLTLQPHYGWTLCTAN